MSDFLTRLALRAADAPTGLRPRLPLRFEREAPAPAEWADETSYASPAARPAMAGAADPPVAPPTAPPTIPHAAVPQTAQRPVAHRVAPASPSPFPSPAAGASTGVSIRPQILSEQRAETGRGALPSAPTTPPNRDLGTRAASSRRGPAVAHAVQPAPVTPLAVPDERRLPASASVARELAWSSAPPQSAPVASAAAAPPAPVDVLSSAPRQQAASRRVAAQVAAPAATPATPLQAPVMLPSSPPTRRADAAPRPADRATIPPADADALPPVIVEIGRIEVRAPPAPPSAPPPPRAPRLSLDAYLDRRGAGR